MENKKVLIIGSRAGGMFLSFVLKKCILKYYIGRGEAFETFGSEFDIILRERSRIFPYKVTNVRKILPLESLNFVFDYIFIAVREPHVKQVLNQYKDIIKHCQLLFLLQNTKRNYLFVRKTIAKLNPRIKVFRLIISNGLDYLSGKTIYVYGKYTPITLILDDTRATLNVLWKHLTQIFDVSKIDILDNQKNIHKFMFLRHAKTLISVFSLKYKLNLFGLFHKPNIMKQIKEAILELSNIMKIDIDIEAIMKKIFYDDEVILYYPTYFKNRFIRFKKDKEWKYFYQELQLLAKENNVPFREQKNLVNLFKKVE